MVLPGLESWAVDAFSALHIPMAVSCLLTNLLLEPSDLGAVYRATRFAFVPLLVLVGLTEFCLNLVRGRFFDFLKLA